MIVKTITVPAASTSLSTLLDLGSDRCDSLTMQAPAANSADVTFGDQANQIMIIIAGGSATVGHRNLATIFVKGNGTDTLNILVTR